MLHQRVLPGPAGVIRGRQGSSIARPSSATTHLAPQVAVCTSSGVQAAAQDVSSTPSGPATSSWTTQLQRCCTAVAAALVLTSSACSDASAAMATAQPSYASSMSVEERIKSEEAQYDENLMTADLRSFMELLSKKGSNIKAEELEGPRSKLGFRRTADGRVSLRSRDGRWFNVKADMQTPGFLLLRDMSDGTMFFLPPDDSGQLQQVDLSDDAVVAQLFASGAWYDVMDPLKVQEGARAVPLKLSEVEFRLITTLLQDAEEEQLPAEQQ